MKPDRVGQRLLVHPAPKKKNSNSENIRRCTGSGLGSGVDDAQSEKEKELLPLQTSGPAFFLLSFFLGVVLCRGGVPIRIELCQFV